jgi:hypothetical protein
LSIAAVGSMVFRFFSEGLARPYKDYSIAKRK